MVRRVAFVFAFLVVACASPASEEPLGPAAPPARAASDAPPGARSERTDAAASAVTVETDVVDASPPDGGGDAGVSAAAVGERADGLVDREIVDCHSRNDGVKGAGTPVARVYAIGTTPFALAQDFTGGYLGPTSCIRKIGAFAAYMVRGDIRTTWLEAGAAAGPLGLPTSDELDGRQTFEHGYVAWDPDANAYRAYAN